MSKLAFIDVTATVSYGGLQTWVWQCARVLAAMGHQVTVIGGDGAIRPLPADSGVRVVTFPFTPRERVPNLGSRFQRLVERLTLARHARRWLSAERFDWVLLNKPFDFFWPWLLETDHPTRFAFCSGGTDFIPGDRKLARRLNAWLACSHFNAWQISSHFKQFPGIMYNGVEVERFHPEAGDPGLRADLGLAPETLLLGFAGRLVGWKGLSVAVRAVALVRDLPVALLIIGAGPDLLRLQALARTLGVEERVRFQPPVPHAELPAWYGAVDVGVFPSIGDEAFGITIAEAMACGKPVLASHVGGIPEVVGNEGRCGRLFPIGDHPALAQQIRELAADPTLRQALGQAGRERICQMFTWERTAERILAALDGVNEAARPPAGPAGDQ